MNMYNFVFCFFYNVWQKRTGDGRFSGMLHVQFTIMMHLLLLCEIFWDLTGIRPFTFYSFGESGTNKTIWTILLLPTTYIGYVYYTKKRTKTLLEIYERQWMTKFRRRMSVFLIVVLPVSLLIGLSLIRQKIGWENLF